eukprot:TRINITY_DN49482_c0_g1_i6.p1 TRINITY_DN49482_c0_g1~~TRINITY_DN49482_c0_g1_i6.p1  ORF type:complete len:172 (+),score=35.84 TRINITY_DN49482_c0_g1_i6:50-565(+)
MTVLFSCFFFFFLMIRRPPRSTLSSSSAASDVYKRQVSTQSTGSSRTGMGGMCSSEEERDPCDEESESTPSSTSAPVPEPTELWVTDTELECFDRAPVPREGRMEFLARSEDGRKIMAVSYTHLRAHETPEHLVCRLLLEKKKKENSRQTLTNYTHKQSITIQETITKRRQ